MFFLRNYALNAQRHIIGLFRAILKVIFYIFTKEIIFREQGIQIYNLKSFLTLRRRQNLGHEMILRISLQTILIGKTLPNVRQ